MKRTPLTRKTALKQKSSLKSGGGLKRTAYKPKPTPDPITPQVRLEVAKRSGGACEARATRKCNGAGQHKHHRKLRRHGDHRAVNILDVCFPCHEAIHADPARSYEMGWMLKAHLDPALNPPRTGNVLGC